MITSETYSLIAYAAMLFSIFAFSGFFLRKPLESLLVFFAASSTLQLLNDERIALSDSKTTITFGGIMLCVILLMGGISILFSKANPLRNIRAINVTFGLFIFWMLGSSLYNAGAVDLTAALKELGRILGIYVVFLVGYKYAKSPDDVRKFYVALFVSLIIPVMVSMYQLVMGTEYIKIEKFNRIYATFGIPNMWAMYLILPMLIVLMSFLKRRFDLVKPLLLLALGSLGVLLFFTYTRASWLALIAACTYIAAKKYRRLLPYLAIFVLLLLSLMSVESLRLGSSGSSGRIGLWMTLFPAGFSSPIIGHGIMSMPAISKQLIGGQNQGQNQFLLYWIEGGLVGVTLFAVLLRNALSKLKTAYQQTRDHYLKEAMMIQSAFIIGLIVVAMFESNALFQIWAWMPLGISLGVYYHNQAENPCFEANYSRSAAHAFCPASIHPDLLPGDSALRQK